jgi:gallate decarboxylase subunit D
MKGSSPVTVRVACGALTLEATACRAGRDLSVTISGGERPHLGCVVIATPHPAQNDAGRMTVTSSVVAAPPHREEALARPFAERLARCLGGTVVVAAGVHTGALGPEGIATYLRLGERLAERLLTRLVG